MSVIIAIGSNLDDRLSHLNYAIDELEKKFSIVAISKIYETSAVDYKNQPDFLNQLIELEVPELKPESFLEELMSIEAKRGRQRIIDKGPRTLDIDIIFWKLDSINTDKLNIPHPRWHQRSFICKPLLELPYHQKIQEMYNIPQIEDASLRVFDSV